MMAVNLIICLRADLSSETVIYFLVADTIVMLVHYRAVGELFYIFHHGASIYAYYFVMVSASHYLFIYETMSVIINSS